MSSRILLNACINKVLVKCLVPSHINQPDGELAIKYRYISKKDNGEPIIQTIVKGDWKNAQIEWMENPKQYILSNVDDLRIYYNNLRYIINDINTEFFAEDNVLKTMKSVDVEKTPATTTNPDEITDSKEIEDAVFTDFMETAFGLSDREKHLKEKEDTIQKFASRYLKERETGAKHDVNLFQLVFAKEDRLRNIITREMDELSNLAYDVKSDACYRSFKSCYLEYLNKLDAAIAEYKKFSTMF